MTATLASTRVGNSCAIPQAPLSSAKCDGTDRSHGQQTRGNCLSLRCWQSSSAQSYGHRQARHRHTSTSLCKWHRFKLVSSWWLLLPIACADADGQQPGRTDIVTQTTLGQHDRRERARSSASQSTPYGRSTAAVASSRVAPFVADTLHSAARAVLVRCGADESRPIPPQSHGRGVVSPSQRRPQQHLQLHHSPPHWPPGRIEGRKTRVQRREGTLDVCACRSRAKAHRNAENRRGRPALGRRVEGSGHDGSYPSELVTTNDPGVKRRLVGI